MRLKHKPFLASEGCGLADLAPTLRQKESDSQTETREEEEDWMCGEEKKPNREEQDENEE